MKKKIHLIFFHFTFNVNAFNVQKPHTNRINNAQNELLEYLRMSGISVTCKMMSRVQMQPAEKKNYDGLFHLNRNLHASTDKYTYKKGKSFNDIFESHTHTYVHAHAHTQP